MTTDEFVIFAIGVLFGIVVATVIYLLKYVEVNFSQDVGLKKELEREIQELKEKNEKLRYEDNKRYIYEGNLVSEKCKLERNNALLIQEIDRLNNHPKKQNESLLYQRNQLQIKLSKVLSVIDKQKAEIEEITNNIK